MEDLKDKDIELFLQGEGIPEIQLIRVLRHCTVRELIEKARAIPGPLSPGDAATTLLLEDSDEELALDATLQQAGIRHRQRVHCHRCRRIEVMVNFNGASKARQFPPSQTVAKVKHWADDQFGLKGVDTTEHALQLCGNSTRPDEDIHLGALVRFPHCTLCFDLVPKKRVEG